MALGIPSRIEWRVVDENTGAEVIQRLSHPHEGEGRVRLLMNGYPSQTSLGTCTIPLHKPGSAAWADALEDYRKLRKRLKLEGFTGSDTNGTPRYSYTIDDIDRADDGWTISGVSTLSWLAKTPMLPNEILASPISGVLPTDGLQVVRYLQGSQDVIWADNFSGYGGGTGPHPSSDYTQAGWSFVSSDPFRGKPALTSTNTAVDGYVVTNTTWGSPASLGRFWAGKVIISGTVQAGTASFAGELSAIVLADSTWQNGILAQVAMVATAPTWKVQVAVYSKSAGVYTLRGGPTDILTNIRSPFPFQLVLSFYMNAGKSTMSVLVNGKDAGINLEIGIFSPASGGVGMRFQPTAGGSPQVWINELRFSARSVEGVWGTPRFANGIQSASPASGAIPQELSTSGQSQLDVVLMMATTDGYQLRCTPGRGYRADQVDYDPQPGDDLTGTITLRRGVNIQRAAVHSVAESYGSSVRVDAVPGNDSGGTVISSPTGATGDLVSEDQIMDVGQPGFRFLSDWADLVQKRKENPLQAIELQVVRTADLADAFREGDLVLVDDETLDLNDEEALVVEYGWSETSGIMPVVLNEFPRNARLPTSRLSGPLDYIARKFGTR